jgi:capsular exopolysaccharide synthesis family protein
MPKPHPPRGNEPAVSAPIDFRTLFYTVRERAWLIAVCLVLGLLSAGAYLMRAPRIYAAKSVLQVEQEEQKILKVEGVQQEHFQSLEALKTVEQTLQSPALLARVLDSNSVAFNQRFISPDQQPPPTREQLIAQLDQIVDVKLRKGTRLIDIRVEHTDPRFATLVANSLVWQFVDQGFEQSASASRSANAVLLNEAARLKEKLEQSEAAIQAYREEAQSASFEEQQNVVVQKFKELGARVTEAKSQRILQESAYQQCLQAGDRIESLMSIAAVASNPSVLEIQAQIARQESEIANLKQRYREKHPKFLQASSALTEWKNSLHKAILAVPQSLLNAFESAKSTEAALEQAFREQETAAVALSKQSIRYNVLARDVETDRTMYQAVLSRIKETAVTKELKPSNVRIIQAASIPERPVKPEKVKVMILGLLAGLTSGALLALFLNSLDRSLKTVDHAEEYLQLSVLSAVPRFDGLPEDQRKLILADEAMSVEAESFRTLRTALSMLGRKEDRRVYCFTSALPAEGKTFCSLNYALSLAQQGLRTLVIDCDLRRPMVEKSLVKSNKRGLGLTDYLTGQKTLPEVVHATGYENFSYIPAGTHAPNPAELLAQTGIGGLLDEALQQYDRIVIDSAPIHAVSDTLLILDRIQTLCLVVRARKTPRNSVLRAVQILRDGGAPLAGIILNQMPRRRGGGYYYYYDNYYDYSYQGYYNEKDGKKDKAVAA